MKNLNHSRYNSWFTHPLFEHPNNVPGTASHFKLSFMRTRGYIIMGGMAYPDADTHAITVCVLPLSPDVTAQTLFWPISAMILPGLWTTFMPVSSLLKTCMGLDKRLSRAYNPPNFSKKNFIASSEPALALAKLNACGVHRVSCGCRLINPSNHPRPAIPSLNGCLLPLFSAMIYAVRITSSLPRPYPISAILRQ